MGSIIRWEYRNVVVDTTPDTAKTLNEEMNRFGDLGWELVSTVRFWHNDNARYRLFFKRPCLSED